MATTRVPSRRSARGADAKHEWDTFWKALLRGRKSPSSLEAHAPLQRVAMVRAGVPSSLLAFLADRMEISRQELYTTLGIARSTADRRLKTGEALDTNQSERALALLRLIGQVERLVAESGEPEGFDAATWLGRWLSRPNAALEGRRPGDIMDTAEGRAVVSDLVAQMQTGAYA